MTKTTGIEETGKALHNTTMADYRHSATPFADRDRDLKKSLNYHLTKCQEHIANGNDADLLISLKIVGEYRWELDQKFHQIGLIKERHFALQMSAVVAQEEVTRTANNIEKTVDAYNRGLIDMTQMCSRIHEMEHNLADRKCDYDRLVAEYEAHNLAFDDAVFAETFSGTGSN